MLLKNDFLENEIANNENKIEVNNSNKEIKLKSRESESYIINKIL